MATASNQLNNNPDDSIQNFTIYPAESLTDAIERESYEKRDTFPFGFYYGSFATLVPLLLNSDVFGVNGEALSRMLAPTLSTSLGLFMLVHLIWMALSIMSFFTTPIRQLMGTQRPFLRLLVAFLLTLFAEQINTFGQSALSRPTNFQLNAPGITIDRSVITPGFNLDIPATTISYSVDLISDKPLKTLQAFVDALVDELRHPGALGSLKTTSTRKVRSAVETVEGQKMAMSQTIPSTNTSSIMPSADSPAATRHDELMIENRKRMHDLAWQVRKEIFENGPCPVDSMPSSLTSVSNRGLVGRRRRHLFANLLLGRARPPAERSSIDTNDERVRKLCADAANALEKYLRLVKRRRLPAAGEQYE